MATAIPPVIGAAPAQASWLQRFGPLFARLGFGPSQGAAALRALGMAPPEAAPAAMAPTAPPPAAAAPAPMAPAPAQGDIGPGIAIPQSEAVYARDLPPDSSSFPSFTPAPTRALPPAAAPMTLRYAKPEFIYTNPAAAQQAAANYATRLGYEANQDQGYRDYLARLEADRGATERANVQGQIYGQQLTAAGREGAANRASNERIAGMSDALRQFRSDEAAWQANEQAALQGQGYAETLNRDPNAKVDRRYIKLNPSTGKWESIFTSRPRPVPPNFNGPTAPVTAGTMVTPAWPQPSPLPVPAAPGGMVAGPVAPVTVPDPGPAPMIEGPADLGPLVPRNPFPRNAIGSVAPSPAPSFALPQPRSREELIRFLTAP